MPSAADKFTVPIQCPQCKKKFEKRLADLRANAAFACPGGCGTEIRISGDEFQKVRKALLDFEKQLARLGGTIKIKL